MKPFLVAYTQRQCSIWNIQVQRGVPLPNVYDDHTSTWGDTYQDLPVSPHDGSALLLVPRRIVRALPWINYADFFRFEFSSFLRAKRVQQEAQTKRQVTAITRRDVKRIDAYVRHKEETATAAQPDRTYLDTAGTCPETEALKARLAATPTGAGAARDYQLLILEIFNALFNPDLIDGQPEVSTIDGTERRDLIFTNDSDKSFWEYLRNEHSTILLMLETKNVTALENEHLNQTSTYLGSRLGYLGMIVTRTAPARAQLRKIHSIYNNSQPKKIILVLTDADLLTMLDMYCAGRDPMRHVQTAYRHFRTNVQ